MCSLAVWEGDPTFCRAGTAGRSGEKAKELKAICTPQDVFPRPVTRGHSLPFTHTMCMVFPHEDQPVRAAVPAGLHFQVYDCTPVIMNASLAGGGSKVQQRLAQQNDRYARHYLPPTVCQTASAALRHPVPSTHSALLCLQGDDRERHSCGLRLHASLRRW